MSGVESMICPVCDTDIIMSGDEEKGDEVFYGKYAGTEIKIDGKDYVICRESDILAIVAK